MIELKEVSFAYTQEEQKIQVLDRISLTVREGEFFVILGRNGSGKSTLAKLMNAVLLPETGSVTVDGIDSREDLFGIRSRVGMVFQNPDNQIVATIVEEDVAFAPENLGLPSEEIVARVTEALETVGMTEYRTHAPHMLSGGQKQRVAIAGVLAMHPKYLVLDEPTAMLDPVGRQEVMQTVRRLNREQGMTVILITHNMEETVCADRIAVLHQGDKVMEGTPRELFSRVEELKALDLDVPPVTELAYRLRCDGFPLRQDLLTEQELVEELVALTKTK